MVAEKILLGCAVISADSDKLPRGMMRSKLLMIAAVLSCGLISACGGGGGGGSGSGGSTPAPSINVALSASSGTASVTEGATTTSFNTSATGTASATVTTPVIADVQFDKAVFASVTATPGTTPNSYSLTATTLADLGGGDYTGNITLRLCQDASCSNIYAGSSVTYAYSLTVKLQDWTTLQRNAAHTGYVHVTLDPTKFAKAWTWTGPGPDPTYGRVQPVITGAGSAYVVWSTTSQAAVYSLNEMTGSENWSYYLGQNVSQIGRATYANDTVYLPSYDYDMVNNNGIISGINAVTGKLKDTYFYKLKYNFLNSPTVYGNEMFFSYGEDGGQVYKYDLTRKSQVWMTSYVSSNSWNNQTPAVDDKYVYYNTFYGLAIFNKADGSLHTNIADPKAGTEGYTYYGAPMVTPNGRVIMHDTQKNIVTEILAYDVATKSIVWRAPGRNYISAYANGMIYTIRNIPTVLEVLSEVDGSVQWSWTMPAQAPWMEPNVLVTDNLVFISTGTTTYAIDIKTHQQVWSYPAHGSLSLSSNYVLYITPREYGDGSIITAIKLR